MTHLKGMGADAISEWLGAQQVKIDMVQFEKLKDAFYELRGQDPVTAAPKRETLEALGLKKVADDLEKTGVYKEAKVS